MHTYNPRHPSRQTTERPTTSENTRKDAISIFFPIYNEAGNIEQAVTAALAVLPRIADRGEVIVVDDGSRDGSGAIADRLAAADSRVRVVHHADNRGYGAAVRSGFEAARYPLVVLVDGDNQFELEEVSVLLRAVADFDIVTGFRITRRDPLSRRLYGFLHNSLARLLFRVSVRDVNCGFKIYRRQMLEQLLPQLRSTGALIHLETLARGRKLGARIGEVGVHHFRREVGRQASVNPALIFRAFRDMLALWRQLR